MPGFISDASSGSAASGSSSLPTPALSHRDTPTPGITNPATPVSPPDEICTRAHALYAFDVLASHLERHDAAPPPFANGKDKYALFVTWNTLKPRKTLRGCIGNFTPMRLDKGLAEYALVAALEDHRFSPIRASELPSLGCGVSLLTPFTPVATPLSWDLGTHGIHVTFPHPTAGRTLSATYLPDVAPEQGWSKEQAVLSLIQKAGWRGRVTVGDKVWNSISTKVYGSVKVAVTYDDYVAWKKGGVVEDKDKDKKGAERGALAVLSRLVRG
ncbi:hypothetical protein CcaverHIS002_0207950 [Cutaneotrichosporon cavernicola]|uniref:AMMECR1 domain-containing protein n=1 Tax=Cutaneotrichosporon cavernicola TaxID=279322 RepID=A0AA48IAW3_9TREE|nr:uncharacterized protein CcaverHIS019_0207940 [Cutaneotrichosporon cavernicola]BEI81635.1 hypothetical protein CcaverHIS002_0207950 [Cutaneotrichosporon cavernicola]BEI89432.1 hypothetical protein CcaverHIS019_0207940 [Cutaneotrichosporon cavernicola]BEI97206.1 hypothetical protein CcaverHIS631_0207950 [Cutaneotrichosporon cavernicola]BEJ04980.1 hypothetical protein CcaverHIS641_0207970 [Cutaneotrichosporon cavernicola]